LKIQTDALQKTIPKNDKDIKKKITTEIQQMQRSLNEKHKKELESWEVREEPHFVFDFELATHSWL
jgi:hypothetical protein